MQKDLAFEAELDGLRSDKDTWVTRCSDLGDVTMAVPPGFDGPGGGASPEDLFVMSLINCFGATFKVVAQNSRLQYQELKVRGRIFPGTNEKGGWVIKTFEMHAELIGPSDPEKAKRLLEKASGLCLIINSTTIEKKFTYTVL